MSEPGAAASGSLGDRWVAIGNMLLRGERLSEPMRADFVARAATLYKGQLDIYKNRYEQYKGIATRSGLKVENVVPELESGVKMTGGLPSGVTKEQWEVMTPEEKAVFQCPLSK